MWLLWLLWLWLSVCCHATTTTTTTTSTLSIQPPGDPPNYLPSDIRIFRDNLRNLSVTTPPSSVTTTAPSLHADSNSTSYIAIYAIGGTVLALAVLLGSVLQKKKLSLFRKRRSVPPEMMAADTLYPDSATPAATDPLYSIQILPSDPSSHDPSDSSLTVSTSTTPRVLDTPLTTTPTTATISRYTQPSGMPSPFSPTNSKPNDPTETRRHHSHSSHRQMSHVKAKEFRMEMANIIHDWPHVSDKRSASPDTIRDRVMLSRAKSLDSKSARTAGTSETVVGLPTRTALGAMPSAMQTCLATEECSYTLEDMDKKKHPTRMPQSHASTVLSVSPMPSLPLLQIHHSKLEIQASSGITSAREQQPIERIRKLSIALAPSPVNSLGSSNSSYLLDGSFGDGGDSPAPSSVYMDILETNQELAEE